MKYLPGVKEIAKNLKTEIDIWKYFLSNEVLNLIVHYTNQHIQSVSANYQRERYAKDTDRNSSNFWTVIFSRDFKIKSPKY